MLLMVMKAAKLELGRTRSRAGAGQEQSKSREDAGARQKQGRNRIGAGQEQGNTLSFFSSYSEDSPTND